MIPTVLVLIGLAGSGKTTAAAYFKKKKFPIVRMGEVTDKLLIKSGLPYSEKNEKHIRENLRIKYGQDVYAKKVLPSVLRLIKRNDLIIIDGGRNKEELDLFRKNFANLKIIFLNTGKEIRYKRLQKRRQRPLTLIEAQERDVSELKYFKLQNLRKYADYIVDNNLKLADLYEQLRKIFTRIN